MRNAARGTMRLAALGAALGLAALLAAAQIKPIDLNAATAAQLAAIKGLTPDLAAKILAARPFRSLDELAKVGLIKAQIDAVRPYLTIGGGPRRKGRWRKAAYRLAPGEKVNINTAERKVLEALPGIGVGRAIAIIERRPFARIEDLMKVTGIKAKTFARIRSLVIVK
ncbi:MAG: helix-hairpin-helix domain-containing protein [Acidobacteriota bacterium]|nr:helix-hairpin-helix domain-containing protein [Acidobacteriota bacterium]